MTRTRTQAIGTRTTNDIVIKLAALALLVGAALWTTWSHAQEPFNRGNVSGTIAIGRGEALGNTYTTVGAGIGYMISDGLMAAINGEMWFGDDPDIQKLTPEIRYTFTNVNPVKPYVGGFFTRTFYSGLDDSNSYGVRGGIYIPFSSNAAMNVGLVYEKLISCDESVYRDCSQVYPEAGLLVSF
jgi:hypothetical protein